MPFPNISPIAFGVGPIAIRWYALAYLAGIGLGALYGYLLLSRRLLWWRDTPPFDPPAIFDFAFWAVIGIVAGGRIAYVVFYNLSLYAAHPIEIFQIWDGGMSFHGGLVGLAIAVIYFTRSKGGNVLSSLDLLSVVAPIGIFLVRVANFINGELFGRETTLPWGVIFPSGGPLPRHPSQLYEGLLEGALMLVILLVVTQVFRGLRRPGLTAGIFGVLYALFRGLLEFVRIPDAQLGYLFGGWVTMGQILSLPLLLGGVALIVVSLRRVPGP